MPAKRAPCNPGSFFGKSYPRAVGKIDEEKRLIRGVNAELPNKPFLREYSHLAGLETLSAELTPQEILTHVFGISEGPVQAWVCFNSQAVAYQGILTSQIVCKCAEKVDWSHRLVVWLWE